MAKDSRIQNLVGGVFAGLIVSWTGASLYLKMANILTWGQWGTYYTLGMGGLFLLTGIIFLFVPGMRNGFIGMLITAIIVGVIGLIPLLGGGWHAWGKWWPLTIVAIGLIIIISTIWGVVSRARKEEKES
jgi:hypothetical protein